MALLDRVRALVPVRAARPDPALLAALAELVRAEGETATSGLAKLAIPGMRGAFLLKFMRGTQSNRGTEALLNAYGTMPWLRGLVGKVSRSVAGAEWEVFAVRGQSATEPLRRRALVRGLARAAPVRRASRIRALVKQGDLEQLDASPLLDFLERGNPFHPGLLSLQLTQAHLDLVGEGFWLVERDGAGRPFIYWSIPPSWVRETPRPGMAVPAFVLRVDGVETLIPPSEMIWFQDPDPARPYGRGTGTARALGDELDTDEFAAKYLRQWFLNDAIPPIIISADGLSPGETSRLEQDWKDKNEGFWRRFKPYFLSRKVTVDQLAHSFRDMQVVELRKHERDMVMQVWGVPPEIFGVLESSNRATIEAADYLYSRGVVVPRLELIRVTLQTRLVPAFGDGLVLDYASPVAEDKEFTLKVMTAAAWAFPADEWRDLADRVPLSRAADGAVHLVPFSLLATPHLGDLVGDDAEPLPDDDVDPDDDDAPEDDQGDDDAPDDDEPDDDEPEKTRRGRRKQEELTPEQQAAVRRVLRAIRSALLEEAVQPVAAQIVEDFGTRALQEGLGQAVAFDLSDPRVVDYLAHRTGDKIRRATATTQRRIARTLSDGYELGETLDDLALRVRQVFRQADVVRSQTIARTETVRAANFGQLEGSRQAGATGKEWVSVKDDRTRDAHVDLDGDVVALDEDFVSDNGGVGPHPGEMNEASDDINCRCTTAAVFAEAAARTAEQLTVLWRAFEQERRSHERAYRAAARRGFAAQERAALAALRS